jgi:hypothetical protein
MAKASAALKGIPSEAKAALASKLVGGSLEQLGKVRVFPKGIPFPDEWVISVLPSSAANAKRIVDSLVAKPTLGRFEVFPYGIINPEIGRIEIGIAAKGK